MLNDLKAGLFPGLVVTALVVYALFVLGIPIFSTDLINVVAGGVGSILGVAVKLVTAGILLLICLLPAYIANRRRHHQRTAILAMNICIGLTLIIGGSVAVSSFGAIIGVLAVLAVIGWAVTGWMAALIWALTAPRRIDADGFVIG